MRIYLLIISFCFLSIYTFGQILSSYSFELNKDCDCYIYLSIERHYHIELVYGDKGYTVGVSDGEYKLIKDAVVLTESYNNYHLCFEFKKDKILNLDYLEVKHGFLWMKDA